MLLYDIYNVDQSDNGALDHLLLGGFLHSPWKNKLVSEFIRGVDRDGAMCVLVLPLAVLNVFPAMDNAPCHRLLQAKRFHLHCILMGFG